MAWRLISIEEKTRKEDLTNPPPTHTHTHTHPSGHNDKHTGLLTGTALCVSQLLGKTSPCLVEQIAATTCLSLSDNTLL